MKKQIVVAITVALFSTLAASAQDGPRKTPEERTQVIHHKLDSAFGLSADKLSQIDTIFLHSFKQQQTTMDAMMAGTTHPDREAMKAARDKMIAERDDRLKAVLTTEQMVIWKEQIEPTTRPQRRNPD